MSTGADEIRQRIASVCAGAPFEFTQAQEPFGFERQPAGAIDGVFRIESENASVLGGFNYSEERTDTMRIWVARKQAAFFARLWRAELAWPTDGARTVRPP